MIPQPPSARFVEKTILGKMPMYWYALSIDGIEFKFAISRNQFRKLKEEKQSRFMVEAQIMRGKK